MKKYLLISLALLAGCDQKPSVSLDKENHYNVALVTGMDGEVEIFNEGKLRFQTQGSTVNGVWDEFSSHLEGESGQLYNLKEKSGQATLHKAISDVLLTPFIIDVKNNKSDFTAEEKKLTTALQTLKESDEPKAYEAVIQTVSYIKEMLKDSDGMLVMTDLPQEIKQEKILDSLFKIPHVTVKVEKINDKFKYYSLKTSSESDVKLYGTLTVDNKNNQLQSVVLFQNIDSGKNIKGRSLFYAEREKEQKNVPNQPDKARSINIDTYLAMWAAKDRYDKEYGSDMPIELFPGLPSKTEESFPSSGIIMNQDNNTVVLYVPLSYSQYTYYRSTYISPDNLTVNNISLRDEQGNVIEKTPDFSIIDVDTKWEGYAADKSNGLEITLQFSQPLPKVSTIDGDITWKGEIILDTKELALDAKKAVNIEMADIGNIMATPEKEGEWALTSDSPTDLKSKTLLIYSDQRGISHTGTTNIVFNWFDAPNIERLVLSGLTPYAGLYEHISSMDKRIAPKLILAQKESRSGTTKLHWYSTSELLKNSTVNIMPLQFSQYSVVTDNVDSAVLEKGFAKIDARIQEDPSYYTTRIDIDYPLNNVCKLTSDAPDLQWIESGSGLGRITWDLKNAGDNREQTSQKVNAMLECNTGLWKARMKMEPQLFVDVAPLLPDGVNADNISAYTFFNLNRFINDKGEQLAPVPTSLFKDDLSHQPRLQASYEQLKKTPLSIFINHEGKLRFPVPVSRIEQFEFDKNTVNHRWVAEIQK
ncbi:hypothetical protein AAGH31_003958 [Escherichia coli]